MGEKNGISLNSVQTKIPKEKDGAMNQARLGKKKREELKWRRKKHIIRKRNEKNQDKNYEWNQNTKHRKVDYVYIGFSKW